MRIEPRLQGRPPGLKALRMATHLTQREFARRLGCSIESVKKIEGGRMKVSADVALSAMIAFGVSPQSLALYSVSPADLEGRRYTEQSFYDWMARKPQGASEIKREVRAVTREVSAMLHEAAQAGRLATAAFLLRRFVARAAADFGVAHKGKGVERAEKVATQLSAYFDAADVELERQLAKTFASSDASAPVNAPPAGRKRRKRRP